MFPSDAAVDPANMEAMAKAIVSSVVRCFKCEGEIGRSDGPDDEYVVLFYHGRTYHERCDPTKAENR